MAKLVVLSAGFNGRTHELNVDTTTIGRVEDNTFQITDPSVSSHHCEIILRGGEVVIKDLGSTNGSFINGEKISESVLKPGQTLRLGQIELQLLTEGMPVPPPRAPAPAPGGSAPAPAPAKKLRESTMAVPRGVNLNELSGTGAGFDTATKGFSKKGNKANKMFLIGTIVALAIIGLVALVVIFSVKH